MRFAHAFLTAAAITAIASAPAHAGGALGDKHPPTNSSGGDRGHTSTSSSGGDGHGSSSSTSSDGTSIPEPSDAILLLMGAAGVVIGRRLHARAKRKL